MKIFVKHGLSKLGLLPALDCLRRLPDIVHWVRNGCIGCAPTPVKRQVVATYLRRFGLTEFMETGTYLGDTLAYIARDKRVSCSSIELSGDYYRKAVERFRSWPNVCLYHGDSAEILPKIVSELRLPALFWLDGHYSGASTAKGSLDTPVSLELAAILDSPIKSHVILIDDARCFDGTNGYPHLDRLLETIRSRSGYKIEVSADIIRVTPA